MSKQEKLLRRIATVPKDFTWSELLSLMTSLGVEIKVASGSARKFRNPDDWRTIQHTSTASIKYSEAVPGSGCHQLPETGGFSLMSKTVSYRGYDGSIIHDSEDQLFHGKVLGIRDMVIYHGCTSDEAEKIFREAVDEYLLDCEKEGKQPPAPFASMPPHVSHELRVKAALFAQEHEIDIDNVLNLALANFFDQAA